MKKLSKALFTLGVIVLGMSFFACTSSGQGSSVLREDFSQSSIMPSKTEYPAKSDNSKELDTAGLTPVTEHVYPLIKIVSTENGGKNGFITDPVAHHVKDLQQSWYDFSNVDAPDPYYEKCTIAVDGGKALEGQVKVRGNWTTNYNKKSLRIKFDKKQSMCGLNGGQKFKNWVLLAMYKDASFLRDAVALKMYKQMFPEYYASDCCLVEVEVNGVYLGVYLLAEQQETKEGRINITEAEKDSADTNIGYLIEFDSYYYTEVENERFEINYGRGITDYDDRTLREIQNGYTIKSDVYSAEQKDFIMKYMNRVWKICYDAAYNQRYFRFNSEYGLEEYKPEGSNADEKCKNCISAVIDITSLADMYIFNEIICDPDLYLTSFFMDIDFGEGGDKLLRFEAPWDFDSTMGNKNFCVDNYSRGNIVGKNDMFAGACQTDVNCEHNRFHANPWMVIFINEPWFQQLIKDQWAAIDSAAILSDLQEFIDDNSSKQYEAVYNYTRGLWGDPHEDWELSQPSAVAAATSQAASAAYLKEWLTYRFGAVDKIINNF